MKPAFFSQCATSLLLLSTWFGLPTQGQESNQKASVRTETIPPSLAPPEARRQRLNAWELGVKLTLVVVDNARGKDTTTIKPRFEQCRLLVATLGDQLPDLALDRDGAFPASFWLEKISRPLLKELEARADPRLAALLEFALQTTLIAEGENRDKLNRTFADTLTNLAVTAALPTELWQPLVAKVQMDMPFAQLRAEASQMQREVAQHLLEPTAPTREAAWRLVLPIQLGDTIDQVRRVYQSYQEPEEVSCPACFYFPKYGVWYFFDSQQKVNRIQVEAPFIGPINGTRIGDLRMQRRGSHTVFHASSTSKRDNYVVTYVSNVITNRVVRIILDTDPLASPSKPPGSKN